MDIQEAEVKESHRCEVCGAEINYSESLNQTSNIDLIRELILKCYE